MSEQRYRLRDSTLVEPLVNHWWAWPYLLSPVAASLHLRNYQLPVMRSYLQDPQAHLRASQDPDLLGGPFVNVPVERADEVRKLCDDTERLQHANIKLADAVTEGMRRLFAEGKGQSLDDYYDRMPEAMRGFAELIYDYNNQPNLRFVEGLLYESPYYDESLQSLRLTQAKSDKERPFFMSTPRLTNDEAIDWVIPFASAQVDELLSLDTEPRPLNEIREMLGDERVLPLLDANPASPPEPWTGKDVRIRYFGHACTLVEHSGTAILTDPLISVLPSDGGVERFTYRDLPQRIDYAIVTHNHCDHFVLETLLRLRHRIDCLVVPRSYGILHGDVSLKTLCRKLGFKRVVEIDAFETLPLPEGEIIAIPFFGEHGDLAHGKAAYVVRTGHERILFGADSNCLDKKVYEHVRSYTGRIDTVFLGVEPVGAPLSWSYGAMFPRMQQQAIDSSRRQRGCDAQRALDLLDAVGASRVYNYGMGEEPWLEHILALASAEDFPQIQESNKLLAKARSFGFLEAERLSGKREIHLDHARPREHVFAASQLFAQAEPDTEDQFAF
jgi:L-ascorbate metabolism protein UlaG (beta-lactamase superfamily)